MQRMNIRVAAVLHACAAGKALRKVWPFQGRPTAGQIARLAVRPVGTRLRAGVALLLVALVAFSAYVAHVAN